MGVTTVTFPQGLEISNFFLRYYRPIRGNWWRKTFVIIFFQVEPYFSLTIIIKWCLEEKTVAEFSKLSGRPWSTIKSIIKKYTETGKVEN